MPTLKQNSWKFWEKFSKSSIFNDRVEERNEAGTANNYNYIEIVHVDFIDVLDVIFMILCLESPSQTNASFP